MASKTDGSSEPATGGPHPPIGRPILVTQAGEHGNRGVLLPVDLDHDLLRSVLDALTTTDEERPTVTAVPPYTVASRRVRATSDCTARAWDVASRQPLAEVAGHDALISGVAVSHDGAIAATAGWDHSLRTWHTRTGERLADVTDQTSRFSGCALDRSGEALATTGFDGTVGLYAARTGELLIRTAVPVNLPGAVAVDAAGTVVFAGGQDGSVRRIRREGDELEPLDGHEGPVTALAMSPNGRLLASAGRDGAVIIWNVEDATRVMRLSGHARGATACAFLGSAQLLTAGWDGVVRLWSPLTRTASTIWQDPSPVRALAVIGADIAVSHQDGAATGLVAVSNQDGAVTVLDPTGRAEPVVLTRGAGHVDILAGAAGAPVLVTGSTNDVPGGVPVMDGYGRAATFTEGLLMNGDTGDVPAPVWHRVHAESLTAMGIASADPDGRTIVASPPIAVDSSRH
ncbi:hypothetical protein AB0K00_32210 [Dactylosporangium sp. NPDC049525]|uniref:WD40 repeat domain-containing protein n=1 Tax=Dactylosporangium sp. NPDC049525 TaxID=3154730 RepID=UPI0034377D57